MPSTTSDAQPKEIKNKSVLILEAMVVHIGTSTKYSATATMLKTILELKDGENAAIIGFDPEAQARLAALKVEKKYRFYDLSTPITPRGDEITYFFGAGSVAKPITDQNKA